MLGASVFYKGNTEILIDTDKHQVKTVGAVTDTIQILRTSRFICINSSLPVLPLS